MYRPAGFVSRVIPYIFPSRVIFSSCCDLETVCVPSHRQRVTGFIKILLVIFFMIFGFEMGSSVGKRHWRKSGFNIVKETFFENSFESLRDDVFLCISDEHFQSLHFV